MVAYGQEPTLALRWSGSAVEWAADTRQGHESSALSPELQLRQHLRQALGTRWLDDLGPVPRPLEHIAVEERQTTAVNLTLDQEWDFRSAAK